MGITTDGPVLTGQSAMPVMLENAEHRRPSRPSVIVAVISWIKAKKWEGLGPDRGTQPCVDDPFVAHKSKKNKPDGASCETTTMDDLLGDIDQRKVFGGHVHTKVVNLF